MDDVPRTYAGPSGSPQQPRARQRDPHDGDVFSLSLSLSQSQQQQQQQQQDYPQTFLQQPQPRHHTPGSSPRLSVSPRTSSRNFKNAPGARSAPSTPPPPDHHHHHHHHHHHDSRPSRPSHRSKGKQRQTSPPSMRDSSRGGSVAGSQHAPPPLDDGLLSAWDHPATSRVFGEHGGSSQGNRSNTTLGAPQRSASRHRHSHGLSWSSETRDDIVDNLLFSLDNLSRGHVALEPEEGDFDESRDDYLDSLTVHATARARQQAPQPSHPPPRTYQPTLQHSPMELFTGRARRGTASSAATSDDGFGDSPNSRLSAASPGRRSNSSAQHHYYPPKSTLNQRFKSMRSAIGRSSSEAARHAHHPSGGSSSDLGAGAASSVFDEVLAGTADSSRLAWAHGAGRSFSLDNMQLDSSGGWSTAGAAAAAGPDRATPHATSPTFSSVTSHSAFAASNPQRADVSLVVARGRAVPAASLQRSFDGAAPHAPSTWGAQAAAAYGSRGNLTTMTAQISGAGRDGPEYSSDGEDDAAPVPIVAAGPRKQQNPTGTGPVYVGPANAPPPPGQHAGAAGAAGEHHGRGPLRSKSSSAARAQKESAASARSPYGGGLGINTSTPGHLSPGALSPATPSENFFRSASMSNATSSAGAGGAATGGGGGEGFWRSSTLRAVAASRGDLSGTLGSAQGFGSMGAASAAGAGSSATTSAMQPPSAAAAGTGHATTTTTTTSSSLADANAAAAAAAPGPDIVRNRRDTSPAPPQHQQQQQQPMQQPPQQQQQAQPREKQGFFKRVFGGGNSAASRNSVHPSTMQTSSVHVAAAATAAGPGTASTSAASHYPPLASPGAASAATTDRPPSKQVSTRDGALEQPLSPSQQSTNTTTTTGAAAPGGAARSRSYTSSAHDHHERTMSSAGTHPPPPPSSLNKKPSSFFRRRKKSTSESSLHPPPPPLPLTSIVSTPQAAAALSIKPPEPSPSISSLRKAMGVYLSGGGESSKDVTATAGAGDDAGAGAPPAGASQGPGTASNYLYTATGNHHSNNTNSTANNKQQQPPLTPRTPHSAGFHSSQHHQQQQHHHGRPYTRDSTNTDDLDIFHHGYGSPIESTLASSLRPMSEQGNTPAPGSHPHARSSAVHAQPPRKVSEPYSSATMGAAHTTSSSSTLLARNPNQYNSTTTNTNYVESPGDPKVSPLLRPVHDRAGGGGEKEKENAEPSSRPSTGEKIIIAGGAPGASPPSLAASPYDTPPIHGLREFSAGTGVSLDMNDPGWGTRTHPFERAPGPGEDWVVTRHAAPERPSSKRSERLILQPSPSGSGVLKATIRDDSSPIDDVLLSDPAAPAAQKQQDEAISPTAGGPAIGLGLGLAPTTSNQDISRQSSNAELREAAAAAAAVVADEGAEYRERAQRIFDGDEEDVSQADAAAWMGERNTLSARTLEAYMQLFDFGGQNILAALRTLCAKLTLRGETQQFDRLITALSARWCACNPRHGFVAQDVVHTIVYSVILLNTDLHLADIPEKMSRTAYVKNTLPTIRRVVADAAPGAFDETLRPGAGSAAAAGYGQPPGSSASATTRPTAPWMDLGGFHSPTSPTFAIPEITGSGVDGSRASLDHGNSNNPNNSSGRTATMSSKRLSYRPGLLRSDSESDAPAADGSSSALVNHPWTGSSRGWENEVEAVLKSFYTAIGSRPLPLQSALAGENNAAAGASSNNLSVFNLAANAGRLTRTGSIASRAPSDNMSYRSKQGGGGFGSRWPTSRASRSRQRVYQASTVGSSRTSLEDGGSLWSPTQSSKYSFSKTLTSASVGSLGAYGDPLFKHSIGFANALSQAIIREETTVAGANGAGTGANGANGGQADGDGTLPAGGLLEDDTLALEGAPWAKEGLVKHKHHLETTDRKAKERSWVDCFAVISKGKLTLFAFGTSSKSQSLGRKAGFGRSSGMGGMGGFGGGGKAASVTGATVGGGDWMGNAEQLEVFTLRQTIASTLPPPGYSKQRPHVWALSLPSGAVHLFQVGTPEIAAEFMTTANYWSARLSKEPLQGGVSNIEYGWSDRVLNGAGSALAVDRARSPASVSTPPSSLATRHYGGHHGHHGSGYSMSHERGGSGGPPRSSLQSGSLRSSFDTLNGVVAGGAGGGSHFGGSGSSKARLPGDKVPIVEWQPPPQSMMASQLMEVDQLRQLSAYVAGSEEELERHNELKHAIELAYSPRHPNFQRAMANWQRKSDYLLREIVKFRTYIDSLTAAQQAKEAFYERKKVAAKAKADASAAAAAAAAPQQQEEAGAAREIHTSG